MKTYSTGCDGVAMKIVTTKDSVSVSFADEHNSTSDTFKPNNVLQFVYYYLHDMLAWVAPLLDEDEEKRQLKKHNGVPNNLNLGGRKIYITSIYETDYHDIYLTPRALLSILIDMNNLIDEEGAE